MTETLVRRGAATVDGLKTLIISMNGEEKDDLLMRMISVEGGRIAVVSTLEDQEDEKISEVANNLDDIMESSPNPWVGLPLPIFRQRQQPPYTATNPQFTGYLLSTEIFA